VEVDQETVHQHKLEHLEDQVVVRAGPSNSASGTGNAGGFDPPEGNPGSTPSSNPSTGPGGGGGAGAAGAATGSGGDGGRAGGAGLDISPSFSPGLPNCGVYAGGGGGGGTPTAGAGGTGGGVEQAAQV
jgi:hypothetical protein